MACLNELQRTRLTNKRMHAQPSALGCLPALSPALSNKSAKVRPCSLLFLAQPATPPAPQGRGNQLPRPATRTGHAMPPMRARLTRARQSRRARAYSALTAYRRGGKFAAFFDARAVVLFFCRCVGKQCKPAGGRGSYIQGCMRWAMCESGSWRALQYAGATQRDQPARCRYSSRRCAGIGEPQPTQHTARHMHGTSQGKGRRARPTAPLEPRTDGGPRHTKRPRSLRHAGTRPTSYTRAHAYAPRRATAGGGSRVCACGAGHAG